MEGVCIQKKKHAHPPHPHPPSQLLRLGLALALAPLTDAALDAVRAALRLRSKRAAFAACVAVLGGCASAVLVGRTLAWV